MFENIEGKYDPSQFEKKIYEFWENRNYFHAEVDRKKPPFCMVIPPPNVTGYLHVGHALNNTLQDVIIRYKRMSGYNASWTPGVDHAGIATQNVVERNLEERGTSRFEMGRGKFIEEVWKWKQEYGGRIISQLKSLGCSCDWPRQRFTLDEEYVGAVTREFVTLYNEGLIYRGNYMINWCPRCQTALSDIEVEHTEKKGRLWDIKYPLIDKDSGKPSKDEYIVVSTTRPETMLGDTAVAVNPSDKRYVQLKGRKAYLPLVGRIIPIIEDSFVDKEFGSGAVKVTPAHDPNDFEMGKRHGLEEVNIFTGDGTVNENGGDYNGLDRFVARQKVLEDLKEKGYLLGDKEHISSIGKCSRCDTIIEPRISLQWFVSMKKLAQPAIEAVKSGKVKFIPKKWEKIYFNWMENIRDWCISRQLWWGHRIPVWYCQECNGMVVTEKEPQECPNCGGNLVQDKDVLDTWFSSCLWPFATAGWPEDTPELHYFFPTALLITAHDIIFFWVARMIMMSLHFMGEVPFKEVFLNPLVNDASGQKMSKSKGNVVDPMEMIEKHGADVLRFTLTSLTTPGKNLMLGDEKIEGTKNFANKLWNASKFVLSNIEGTEAEDIKPEQVELNIWDRWILSRLNNTIKGVEKYLAHYNFSFASRLLYNFLWSDYCDWYIEASKVRIYYSKDQNDKITTRYILWHVLENYLRMLHPFMPFITEKIWQNMPHSGESLIIKEYPQLDEKKLDGKVEKRIGVLFAVISEIRKIRSELKINPSSRIKVNIAADNKDEASFLSENSQYIKNLAKVGELEFGGRTAKKGFIKTAVHGISIYIYVLDVVNIDLEIKRINDEIQKVEKEASKSRKKMENPQFLKKAPDHIVQKEKNKLEEFKNSLNVLREQLKKMQNIS
ncbi:MAG: valine--tRNA ligase [Candidatus Humimicrobiaceae bacterium]